MTVRISYDVFCDFCGAWTHAFVREYSKPLVKKAREHAANVDWKFIHTKEGYRDICPACQKERQP